MLALAAEAAASRGHFWALTMELLRLRHTDPPDLHAALVRAGLDPDRTLVAMRAGTGADRIAADVASALSSGVVYTPALFVDGERYDGALRIEGVLARLAQ
jgi:2-hydroxychromene-2-carboxylate isomerase